MSDTPRTDAFFNERHTMNAYRKVLAFARQLERELVEAKKDRDNWKQWHENTRLGGQELAADRDRWRKMAEEFGRDFHNYPNVPSHQRCLEALSRFNAMKGEK